ncbi:MAG: phosphopentomutase [bacterium]
MSRFVFIMIDGAGAGALPDAPDYGDGGSDTLGNLSQVVDLRLPFLRRLGLGNILPLTGVPPVGAPLCLPGRLAPLSAGKDTTVGHWEHMGLVTARPFPTYPEGFPDEVLAPFEERIGRGVLGNTPASGTAIIVELGAEHLRTGKPIVYTSADSVFQIATHVDVVPLEQLYGWCQIARDLLQGRHAVARVIARPFAGPPDAFFRTADRRDFSLPPPSPTYLDLLHDAGVPVLALGKISEVFAGRGVTAKVKVASNADNLALVLALLRGESHEADFSDGLLFTNLVDFDMVWGHRNDAVGFTRGLEEVDSALPKIVAALAPDDRLVISADHGVDPTTPSTDHSREYVPLLLYPRPSKALAAVYEGSFADTGATIYEYLTGQEPPLAGDPVDRMQPARGWRRYTPAQSAPAGVGLRWPGQVGPEEARAAAKWLRTRLGKPPEAAIVLGSGLAQAFSESEGPEIPYRDVPHWRTGAVSGHPQMLALVDWGAGDRVALLKGRIHGYEGFDLSELQIQVRTLAAWGVPRLVLTSACGAVAAGLAAGTTVIAREVIDLQYPSPDGNPARLEATGERLATATLQRRPAARNLVAGRHGAVPGPQYETTAELAVLRALGITTVSMSGAGELRAAHDEGLECAMICQVANAGATSHSEVLEATAQTGGGFAAAISALLSAWGIIGSSGGGGAAEP